MATTALEEEEVDNVDNLDDYEIEIESEQNHRPVPPARVIATVDGTIDGSGIVTETTDTKNQVIVEIILKEDLNATKTVKGLVK